MKKSAQAPGPGGYDPKPVFEKGGLTVFGKDARAGIYDEKKAKFVPSPFAYK